MNTDLTITRRTTALAACLALLFAGATACGTEHRATPAQASRGQAYPSSIDLIEKEKANQQSYRGQLKAQHHPTSRPSPGFGDDRRQEQALPPSRGFPGPHPTADEGQALSSHR